MKTALKDGFLLWSAATYFLNLEASYQRTASTTAAVPPPERLGRRTGALLRTLRLLLDRLGAVCGLLWGF
jgi:hypothetical protein